MELVYFGIKIFDFCTTNARFTSLRQDETIRDVSFASLVRKCEMSLSLANGQCRNALSNVTMQKTKSLTWQT